jgi:peptidoglycan hydrolase CwlO-like protein
MKKIISLVILVSLIISFVGVFGCGPKYASKETMAELEEAQAACEKAKAEVKSLETRIEDLKEEKAAKEARIVELEKQLEELKGK